MQGLYWECFIEGILSILLIYFILCQILCANIFTLKIASFGKVFMTFLPTSHC